MSLRGGGSICLRPGLRNNALNAPPPTFSQLNPLAIKKVFDFKRQWPTDRTRNVRQENRLVAIKLRIAELVVVVVTLIRGFLYEVSATRIGSLDSCAIDVPHFECLHAIQ